MTQTAGKSHDTLTKRRTDKTGSEPSTKQTRRHTTKYECDLNTQKWKGRDGDAWTVDTRHKRPTDTNTKSVFWMETAFKCICLFDTNGKCIFEST